MLRIALLSFFAALVAGQWIDPDERPRLYTDPLVTNIVDPLTKQGVSYRLPNDTIPHRYDISLSTRIDLGVFDFSGNVIILIEAIEATSVITVHSKQLIIQEVVLRHARTQALIKTLFKLIEPLEFLEISTATPLVIGQNYTLEISYNGFLRSDNGGFYRSNYTNEVGMIRWLAATQFERTEARHAFPCYDEPGIRTVFGFRMTHGRTYNAVSNMPVKEIIQGAATTVITVYEDSPIMQTYLLAFLVSDFPLISNADTKLPTDVLQRVVGRSAFLNSGQADFALEAGVKILKSFEEHFDYKYPLPKIDQAGVPGFGSAMENWGLVTYRESLLYYDPSTQSLGQKETVAGIVAHEYAHQWFGNIVSPTWWEFIWLNEGFATLYEFFGADLAYPEFRFNDLMVVRTLQSVFERDAYETTRPMNTYYESPADLRSLFDFVAYDKSGCVLRMIQHVLTDATFTKGLNYYFNEMQYKAADPYDLYRNWEKAAREDSAIPADASLFDIMDSWTYQKGYPAIHVTRNDDGVITVKQERFLLEKLPTSLPQSWHIPYNFVVKSSADFSKTTPDGWIPKDTESITIASTVARPWTSDEWVVFNKQQTGYYRVNYDERLWGLLVDELNDGDFTRIHVLNRAQLIDDAYTFARVDQAKYSTAFRLMEYLSQEMDYVPWVAANRALTTLDRMLAGSDLYPHFQTFVLHIVQPIFERFGVRIMESDAYLDRHARNIAVKWACYVGFEKCREDANGKVQEFINDNVVSRSMCNGLRHVDEAEFLAVWHKQQASSVPFDRELLIVALGCVENKDILKIYLETTISNIGVYYTDAERVAVLTAVTNAGIVGVEAVLEFLHQHHTVASGFYSLVVPVNGLAAWISTPQHASLFKALIEKLVEAEDLSAADGLKADNIVQKNLAWMTAHLPDVTWYLEDFVRRSGSLRLFASGSLLAFSIVVSSVHRLFHC